MNIKFATQNRILAVIGVFVSALCLGIFFISESHKSVMHSYFLYNKTKSEQNLNNLITDKSITMPYTTPFQFESSEELTEAFDQNRLRYDVSEQSDSTFLFTYVSNTGERLITEVTTLDQLLVVIPHFRTPADKWLLAMSSMVNQLTNGYDHELISDPETFSKEYLAEYQSEDTSVEQRPGHISLNNFGLADTKQISRPTFLDGTLTFYVKNLFLGHPYRVTYKVGETPIYEPVGIVTHESDASANQTDIQDAFPVQTEADWILTKERISLNFLRETPDTPVRVVVTDTKTNAQTTIGTYNDIYQVFPFLQNDTLHHSETLAFHAQLVTSLTFSPALTVITEQPTNYDLLTWGENEKKHKQYLRDSLSAPLTTDSSSDIDTNRLEQETDFSVVAIPKVTYPLMVWYVQPLSDENDKNNVPFRINYNIAVPSLSIQHLDRIGL